MKLILLAIFAILALEASAAEKKYVVRAKFEWLDEIVEKSCGNVKNLENIAARNNLETDALLKKAKVIYIECKPPKSKKPARPSKQVPPAVPVQAAEPAQPAQAQDNQGNQGGEITYNEYNGNFNDSPIAGDAKADSAKNANECKAACTSSERCRGLEFTNGKCSMYGMDLYLKTNKDKPIVWIKAINKQNSVAPYQID